MRRQQAQSIYFVFIIIFCSVISFAQAQDHLQAKAHSLDEAYTSALKQSEDVAVQREILNQAKELESQSNAAFLPTVKGSLPLYTDSSRWGNSSLPGPATNGKLTLDQPLFRGFRDLALLKQRKALTSAQKFQVQEMQRQLLKNVANSYYTVLSNQSDETNFQNEIDANNRRMKELRTFLKIGKAQDSDILTFEANISTLEAQLENTRGQLEIARQNLAFLTGWDSKVFLNDRTPGPPPSLEVTSFVQKLKDRPDVLASKAQVQAAQESIELASGQHWPAIDLQANYNFPKPGDPPGGETDAQLVLSVPLFEGGSVNSQVRQAKALTREREFELSKAIRSAETEIKTTYASFESSRKQIEKYENAVALSKKNYEVMGRNFRRGLVTNLEVLQALTTYQASQRTLERQKILAKLNYANLKVISGEMPDGLGAPE